MKVSVLVPFHFGANQSRQTAWNHARTHWLAEHPGVQLVVGGPSNAEMHLPQPWSKGRVLQRLRSRARGGVLVVADADCLVSREQLIHAVTRVVDGAAWAVPYTWVLRLDQRSTERLYSEHRRKLYPKLERGKYRGIPGGGIVVMRLDVWDRCPVDPRFTGWGGEDIAWGHALGVLYGPPLRHPGDLIHLWHEPQFGAGSRRPALPESVALLERYEAATTDDEILTILREVQPPLRVT